ncbi:hypothetical protein RclHR1_14580002 [Rhizophagus clarus]|uniref:Uncharacterized protein n=1 Tax=Rhizophagus clarus TaxID=94130 RepID=A0A2Z6QCZ9_9GLOM|nr:hypothetical protein RclHR1_14580002 [Rhizophagus clarus]GES97803.1 hypothetical protein RCL_jg3573.t1 [Rhizophagus clarus]
MLNATESSNIDNANTTIIPNEEISADDHHQEKFYWNDFTKALDIEIDNTMLTTYSINKIKNTAQLDYSWDIFQNRIMKMTKRHIKNKKDVLNKRNK